MKIYFRITALFLLYFIQQSFGLELNEKKIVIIGDSITQAGNYVSYSEYLLQKNYPGEKFNIISVGLSSETVSGTSENDHPFPRPNVLDRIENILKELKPEIIISCYGMNDGIYHPLNEERQNAFVNGYKNLISITEKFHVQKVVILGPPFFDNLPIAGKTTTNEPFGFKSPFVNYNDVLESYEKSLQQFTSERVTIISLNTPMKEYVLKKRESNNSFSLAKDGVHPNSEGHLLMATTLLKGLGYQNNLPEPDKTEEIEKDPLFKLINERRVVLSKGWLDYIGYVRGKTVKSNSITETENKSKELQTKIEEYKNNAAKSK